MENAQKKFWEVKAKDAKETLLADPVLLWEAAVDFFNFCYNNPLGSCNPGDLAKARVQPFTLQGFSLYIGCTAAWLTDFKKTLKTGKNELTDTEQEILNVLNRIEEVVYLQKFSNAAVGFFNSRIISHDLGFYEKKGKPEPKPLIFKFVD